MSSINNDLKVPTGRLLLDNAGHQKWPSEILFVNRFDMAVVSSTSKASIFLCCNFIECFDRKDAHQLRIAG